MNGNRSLASLLLAFRQAKNAIAAERGGLGLLDFSRFEANLIERLRRLQPLLRAQRWFDRVRIGRLMVLPKSAERPAGESGLLRVGCEPPAKLKLRVRFQLEPSPEFAIAEVLYLWEFGGALEGLLDDSCLGYRLKRVREDGVMDRRARAVYDHWRPAFKEYRDAPIRAARSALRAGRRVVITSTDVVSFFDTISPDFLLSDSFVDRVTQRCRELSREFSPERYRRATASLLTKFAQFRNLRRKVGGSGVDVDVGVPIGALTSRVFANVVLSGLDAHLQALPETAEYRRYVDDIVIVSAQEPASDPAPTKADVLGRLFPGFSTTAGGMDRFTEPLTGASFELNERKTLIHVLAGEPGLEFLAAVQQSFSAVVSERRAFLSDVDRLKTDIANVDLFGDDAAGSNRIPRLRDADRFALRRYMATAYLQGLERSALLLPAPEASAFLEERTQQMLSVLDGSEQFDDFELVVGLLKVALLCRCRSVVERLFKWLDARFGAGLADRVDGVVWCAQPLRLQTAVGALRDYLRRRVDEAVSTAADPNATSIAQQVPVDRRKTRLLRSADLRYLDREDDASVFGAPRNGAAGGRHRTLRLAVARDPDLRRILRQIRSFQKRSRGLGETLWSTESEITLLLSAKPPQYVDIARRFLARLEVRRAGFQALGAAIDACVDAFRGTRYGRRASSDIGFVAGPSRSTLRVGSTQPPATVRVILSNLLLPTAAFHRAADGQPVLTPERLRVFDQSLRDAARVAREARPLPAVLVLPELSVPRKWLRTLIEHAVREEIAIVAGVEYALTPKGLVNQAVGVFPLGRQRAALVSWTKRNPGQHEDEELGAGRFRTFSPMPRLVVESAHGRLGLLVCSEILEARALSSLSCQVEILLVPAWNKDTPSFEYAAHSAASLLVHTFVCVANNAEASDSRVVAPIKGPRFERDWCRLIHRNASQVIWADLPVAELRAVHDAPTSSSACLKVGAREYRPLPPGIRPRTP